MDSNEIGRHGALRLMAAATAGAAGREPAERHRLEQLQEGDRRRCGTGAAVKKQAVDFADPAQLLRAYVRTEGDASGKQHIAYGYGSLFSFDSGYPDRKLIDTEQFATRRYVETEDGSIRYHREVVVYRDPVTGRIIQSWYNPVIDRHVEPIELYTTFSRRYRVADVSKTLQISAAVNGNEVFFRRGFFSNRPSELQPRQYPLHAQDAQYESAETMFFLAKLSDLQDPSLSAVPTVGGVNRFTNFLPWMEMDNVPGWLVWDFRVAKLAGVEQLPRRDLVDYVNARYPGAFVAPTEFSEADNTSTGYAYYKEVIDQRTGRGR